MGIYGDFLIFLDYSSLHNNRVHILLNNYDVLLIN